jgi:SlyX protein|tara:strand:+ start:9 stop:218 length:210 start_codon:yes stop_codon:yes gene_type:complete
MDKKMVEERISELETMLAFQDQTISSLSEELFVQQAKLNEFDRTLKALIKSYRENMPETDLNDEIPPHY